MVFGMNMNDDFIAKAEGLEKINSVKVWISLKWFPEMILTWTQVRARVYHIMRTGIFLELCSVIGSQLQGHNVSIQGTSGKTSISFPLGYNKKVL